MIRENTDFSQKTKFKVHVKSLKVKLEVQNMFSVSFVEFYFFVSVQHNNTETNNCLKKYMK